VDADANIFVGAIFDQALEERFRVSLRPGCGKAPTWPTLRRRALVSSQVFWIGKDQFGRLRGRLRTGSFVII
jgi:hypothetical protein